MVQCRAVGGVNLVGNGDVLCGIDCIGGCDLVDARW